MCHCKINDEVAVTSRLVDHGEVSVLGEFDITTLAAPAVGDFVLRFHVVTN